MPEINSIGAPIDKDLDIKLTKGPGQNYDNDLLFSEHSTCNHENLFDFSLRAFISTSQTPPNANLINRGHVGATTGGRKANRPPPYSAQPGRPPSAGGAHGMHQPEENFAPYDPNTIAGRDGYGKGPRYSNAPDNPYARQPDHGPQTDDMRYMQD